MLTGEDLGPLLAQFESEDREAYRVAVLGESGPPGGIDPPSSG